MLVGGVAKVVVVVLLTVVEMLFFMVGLLVVHCSWLLLTRFLISSLEYLFTCLLFPMLFRVRCLLLDIRRALEYRVIHLHGSLYALKDFLYPNQFSNIPNINTEYIYIYIYMKMYCNPSGGPPAQNVGCKIQEGARE